MQTYLFSLEAISSILVECYRPNNNCETGGILIGPKSHKRIVTDILPSTAFAERQPATFYQSEEDVRILNRELKEYQARGYDFKGYFHKHPSGLYQLSHGDINTCAEILQSPEYKINNNLVMCIITESHSHSFPIFSYLASMSKDKRVIVNELSVKVLPKRCIEECMDCFEEQPAIEGVNYENHHLRQDCKGTEKPEASDTVRPSGETDSDNQFSGGEELAGESRSVLSRETSILSMNGKKLNCSRTQTDGTMEEIEVEVINYTTDFNKRNHGILDESVLQQMTVTVIGLGSGGSALVLDLVRCGVTNLNLIEFDTVSISNLCRSVYDLPDVGRKKTESLLEKLLRVNPCVNIQIYDEDVTKMGYEKLMEIINSSDLIIEATDSAKTKILINGLARNNTPVLYPAVYEGGKGGDILLTLPGLPCYECVFHSILDEMKELKKGEWDYTTGQPKPMPGLISDISVVVARTVKLALALLTGDGEDSFVENITVPGCTLLFISNDKDCFGFDQPFQELWKETEINPKCSCQTLC